MALQELLHGRVSVAAGRTEDEDVEPELADAHTEVERLERALLTDRDLETVDLVGARERQCRRVAAPVERVRLETRGGCRSKGFGHSLRETMIGQPAAEPTSPGGR